jgi:hypothetical protein
MNLPQVASLALLTAGGVWLFTPNPSEADPGGGVSSGAVPAPEPQIIARVRSAVGSPEIQVPGKDRRWSNVGVAYEIVSGSALTTDFGEELIIDLPGGGTLTLAPGSLMTVGTDADGTPTFRLERGNLTGFVEGGPVGFETLFGGGMILRPNPGQRARVSLGNPPAEVVGLSPTPWNSRDWSVFDGNIFLPTLTRGINANAPAQVIPEPGTVALLLVGTALLFRRATCRR